MRVPPPPVWPLSQPVAAALYGRPWTVSTHGAGNGAWGQRVGGGTQPTWANSIKLDSPHPRGLVGMPTWKGVFWGGLQAKALSSRKTHWEFRAVSAPPCRAIFQGVYFLTSLPPCPRGRR